MLVRRLLKGLLVTVALTTAACGSTPQYANENRPAANVLVSASIDADGVRLSPARIGAGPVQILVINLTDRTRRLTLESDTLGAEQGGIRQQTAPINPKGTAQLSVDVRPGRYLLHTGDEDAATTLRVGKDRPSAQNQLLLP